MFEMSEYMNEGMNEQVNKITQKPCTLDTVIIPQALYRNSHTHTYIQVCVMHVLRGFGLTGPCGNFHIADTHLPNVLQSV